MTDWIDYTQCSECRKQCQNDGHCIGGMGGKDTKCPRFIRYVPKIRVEKQVWESTLHRSMVLQAENEKLKELLEECSPYIGHSAASRMIKNSAGHKKDMKLLAKIDEVLK